MVEAFHAPERTNPLIDYEYGGLNLQNASSGLNAALWKCFYENGAIKLAHSSFLETVLMIENVSALSFAFDLNMRPMIAFMVKDHCNLWWYDTSVSQQVTSDLGADITFPQLSLDERRNAESQNADVIFSYIKNNTLCMKLQRERFEIEHEITEAKRLQQIGMMRNNRFGFAYYNW